MIIEILGNRCTWLPWEWEMLTKFECNFPKKQHNFKQNFWLTQSNYMCNTPKCPSKCYLIKSVSVDEPTLEKKQYETGFHGNKSLQLRNWEF